MKVAYIVKKSVKRSPLKPKEKIIEDEYIKLVESTPKLTWLENTHHGKKAFKLNPDKLKPKGRAYLNYDKDDEKSFVNLLFSKSGLVHVRFDYKSTKESLHDLIDLADTIDCNLWQYSPKRQILTHEIVDSRNKRTSPIAKKQAELKPIVDWIYLKGNFEKFQTHYGIKMNAIRATLAKVNKALTTNSIVVLVESESEFFIVGKGIKNLYETVLHKEKTEHFKKEFENYNDQNFEEVVYKHSADETTREKFELQIEAKLNLAISTKDELDIAKTTMRFFA